jgi:hypothetical protein
MNKSEPRQQPYRIRLSRFGPRKHRQPARFHQSLGNLDSPHDRECSQVRTQLLPKFAEEKRVVGVLGYTYETHDLPVFLDHKRPHGLRRDAPVVAFNV